MFTINTTKFSRRSFMQRAGVVGIAGLTLPSWMPRMAFASLPENATNGDILVCIFLRGAMDSLSAVVPYNESHYYDSRPTIQIPDDKVLDLDGQFGFHPRMAPLLEIWQQGDFGIVHAAGSPDPTRSHFTAMDYMERGTPGDKSVATGWIGRHLMTTAERNNSPFRAVGMGDRAQQSLRGPIPAVALKSIADFHLQGRQRDVFEAQAALENLYLIGQGNGARYETYQMLSDGVDDTFEAVRMLENADPTQYTPQHGATYNMEDSFGRGLSQIAQLIRADVGLEVACVDAGGWDTHEFMGTYDEGRMAGLLANLAGNLNAFYTDMNDRMENISVVVMSEFGRRAYENGSRGTDHGHGSCMFLMGRNIIGGNVYGNWPGLAPDNLDRGDLAVTTDFRDVLSEVVELRLRNPALADVFPNYNANYLGVAGAPAPLDGASAAPAIALTTTDPRFSTPMLTGELTENSDAETDDFLDELMMEEEATEVLPDEQMLDDEVPGVDLLTETADEVYTGTQIRHVYLPVIR